MAAQRVVHADLQATRLHQVNCGPDVQEHSEDYSEFLLIAKAAHLYQSFASLPASDPVSSVFSVGLLCSCCRTLFAARPSSFSYLIPYSRGSYFLVNLFMPRCFSPKMGNFLCSSVWRSGSQEHDVDGGKPIPHGVRHLMLVDGCRVFQEHETCTYAAVAPKISILRAFVMMLRAKENKAEKATMIPILWMLDCTKKSTTMESNGMMDATTVVVMFTVVARSDSS